MKGVILANYFARVELHGAEWPDDYEELHEALGKEGFTNCIPLPGGNKRLPTGFYYAKALSNDKQEVYRKVKRCAEHTGYDYEIVVVKSAESVSGLSENC